MNVTYLGNRVIVVLMIYNLKKSSLQNVNYHTIPLRSPKDIIIVQFCYTLIQSASWNHFSICIVVGHPIQSLFMVMHLHLTIPLSKLPRQFSLTYSTEIKQFPFLHFHLMFSIHVDVCISDNHSSSPKLFTKEISRLNGNKG